MSKIINLLEDILEDNEILEEVPTELLEELNVLIWATLRDRDDRNTIDELEF